MGYSIIDVYFSRAHLEEGAYAKTSTASVEITDGALILSSRVYSFSIVADSVASIKL